MIQAERVTVRKDLPAARGRYVLYWMQQSQRAHWNHALEYAVRSADDLGLPVLVAFGLDPSYPEANQRHYTFMLEGLAECREDLRRRGVGFVMRSGSPPHVALELSRNAAMVVCDSGILRHQCQWRDELTRRAERRVVEVNSDGIMPPEAASSKAEYAARTLRPRLQRRLKDFLVPLAEKGPRVPFGGEIPRGGDPRDLSVLRTRALDARVEPVSRHFAGGRTRGLARFKDFMEQNLDGYDRDNRNPGKNGTSRISPWLHFGQVSSLELALAVRDRGGPGAEAFLEQLVVRRELACNFCRFNPDYDDYAGVPAWARKNLENHRKDPRAERYSAGQMENGETRDVYWNAAMIEMRATGFLHPYMRMYWGKKILEWSGDPKQAFHLIREWNNRWFLDGRDPNSFAGVAWIFGTHDRPWPPRPVFGTVRGMTATGLERKGDMTAYLRRIAALH